MNEVKDGRISCIPIIPVEFQSFDISKPPWLTNHLVMIGENRFRRLEEGELADELVGEGLEEFRDDWDR